MGWVVNATPRPRYPRQRPGSYCVGGWVGLRAALNGRRKFYHPPGFDSRTSGPLRVAILTELSRIRCNTGVGEIVIAVYGN